MYETWILKVRSQRYLCTEVILNINHVLDELDDEAFSEGEEDLSPADYGNVIYKCL